MFSSRSSYMICSVAALLLLARPAGELRAFDHGPHFDLTRDALGAEGFGNTAIEVVQVGNWLPDYYENASTNPYSGHADRLTEFLGGKVWILEGEHWPADVVAAADWLHFDSTAKLTYLGQEHGLHNGLALEWEWWRLIRATRTASVKCANQRDIEGLLLVLGSSVHAVQDFYTHTNWVEPTRADAPGYDGPGWAKQGIYGSHPTWFDVPPEVRRNTRPLYAGGAPGASGGQANAAGADSAPAPRGHGEWNSDGNLNLAHAVNKDSPERPCYQDAYVTAYFATRQWVQAMRTWINNEAVWREAQQFSNRHGNQLDHDLRGAFEIEFYAGHWQGQGNPYGSSQHPEGPGGSLDDLRKAVNSYHEDGPGKTVFRRKWEELVPQLVAFALNPTPPDAFPPSTRPMQSETEFACVRINRFADATAWNEIGIDSGLTGGKADFYVRASVAGQQYCSGSIHGKDSFDLTRKPHGPYTFIKALRKQRPPIDEPVTTLLISVLTADASWAGTNDDVYLRINPRQRFLLDKPLYDDFERGDVDTYSINPPEGLRVRDIEFLQIEKSPDGASGGWKLCGIQVHVNGRLLYNNQGINRWLEDDHRTWRAPDFQQQTPLSNDVPVTLRLYDDDQTSWSSSLPNFLGGDDHCDIHPHYGRYDLNLLLNLGNRQFRGDLSGTGSGTSRGGSQYGGRGNDGDRAEIAFSVERISVTPSIYLVPSEQPPLQALSPDLAVTQVLLEGSQKKAVIANRGNVQAVNVYVRFLVDGRLADNFGPMLLAPGQQAAAIVSRLPVGTHTVRVLVDPDNRIGESNESNNQMERLLSLGSSQLPQLHVEPLRPSLELRPIQPLQPAQQLGPKPVGPLDVRPGTLRPLRPLQRNTLQVQPAPR